jgi:hypothetical protein
VEAKCVKCHKGYHYCILNNIGFLEVCTDCDFKLLHHNRRKELKPINFKDRRKECCESQ